MPTPYIHTFIHTELTSHVCISQRRQHESGKERRDMHAGIRCTYHTVRCGAPNVHQVSTIADADYCWEPSVPSAPSVASTAPRFPLLRVLLTTSDHLRQSALAPVRLVQRDNAQKLRLWRKRGPVQHASLRTLTAAAIAAAIARFDSILIDSVSVPSLRCESGWDNEAVGGNGYASITVQRINSTLGSFAGGKELPDELRRPPSCLLARPQGSVHTIHLMIQRSN